jgi:hypothetical protein
MDIVTSCRSWADANEATLALPILTIKMALSGMPKAAKAGME